MKTYKFLLLCLLFAAGKGTSQTFDCGTSRLDSILEERDENYTMRKAAHEQMLLDSAAFYHTDSLLFRVTDAVMMRRLIPVVIHNIGGPMITSAFAQNIINAINDRYKNANAGGGVDTEITFCLARKDPNGNGTDGVTNHNEPAALGPFCNDNISDSTMKLIVSWDPTEYLNIWVCNLSDCQHKGWGSPPSMFYHAANPGNRFRDGVVCDFTWINAQTLTFKAVSLVHEIGHWLNLRHTYGDDNSVCGTSANDDGCSDTPWCTGYSMSNSFNNCAHPIQCQSYNTNNGTRQIENYMDNSDDGCKTMFTLEQKKRMQDCITFFRPTVDDAGADISSCVGVCVRNGRQDKNETGTDCGGPCPACPKCPKTISFKVNGYGNTSGNFVNVCDDGNLSINPWSYESSCISEFLSNGIVKCTEHEEPNGTNCIFKVLKQCHECTYQQLFISLQEVDENRNIIGPEFMHWANMPWGIGIIQTSFNLYDHLPPGASITPGKMYSVKLAVAYPWRYSSIFIKVYTPNITLNNKSITIDEFTDNIIYNNCTVNNNKTMAQNQIKVTGESKLQKGKFYINAFSCSQISSFKTASGGSPEQEASSFTAHDHLKQNSRIPDNPIQLESLGRRSSVKVFPNPASSFIEIDVSSEKACNLTFSILDAAAKTTLRSLHRVQKGNTACRVELSDVSNGLYTLIISDERGRIISTARFVVAKD